MGATHGTFEAYCKQRWDISRSYASRLVDAAAVAETVSHGRQNLPPLTVERHARELAKLHLAKHPETAKGVSQAEGNKRARGLSARSAVRPAAPTFAAKTAAKTGKSERTIEPIPPRQRPQDRVPSSGWRDGRLARPERAQGDVARRMRPRPVSRPACSRWNPLLGGPRVDVS